MNYRSKLWSYEEAYPCFQQILPYVDILSAGRLDAIHFLKVASEDEKCFPRKKFTNEFKQNIQILKCCIQQNGMSFQRIITNYKRILL